MEIKAFQVNNFISSGKVEEYRGILLYGPEFGLISNRAKIIAEKIAGDIKDPFRYIDIDFSKITESPYILSDELTSLSLTGGKRVIRIRNVKPSLPKDITEIIKRYSSKENFLIMTSNELTKASSSRSFFEKEACLISMPCYPESKSSVSQIITSILNKEKIKYDYEIIDILPDLFAENRMLILSELEKLITYAQNKEKITKEDVFKIIENTKEISIDNILTATANKDFKTAENALIKALRENTEPITVIKSLIYYFNRLYTVKKYISSGKSEQQAISSLKPAVFFKNINNFKNHLKIWNKHSILKALAVLTSAEIKAKTTSAISILICKRVILNLSYKGKNI